MIINGVIGDVYGAPIEMMPYEFIHNTYGKLMTEYIITDKIVNRLYTYTDDSEMTLAIIDFLSEYKPNETNKTNDIMKFYIKYFEPFRGYSENTFNMFMQYIENNTYNISSRLSNGGIMRVAPLILYYKKYNIDDTELLNIIKIIHHPTHVNDEAIHTSYIYIKILIEFDKLYTKSNYDLQDEIKKIIIKIFDITKYNIKNKLEYIINNYDIDEYEGLDNLIGYDGILCYETLSVALWCVIKNIHIEPHKILGKGIFYGGDCDTIGSIIGQITGILFGYKSINKDWLNNIDISIFIKNIEKFN
jgi:ADP-ribosylglycohydrolase